MNIDDISDYTSWGLEKFGPTLCDGTVFSITYLVANRVFSENKSKWATFGKVILPFLATRLNIGASLFAKVDQPMPQEKKVEPPQPSPLIQLSVMEKVKEAYRRQLRQLVAALGGAEKRHAAVLDADPVELANLVQQLPLLPQFEGWTVFQWDFDEEQERDQLIREMVTVSKYLKENPKTILYLSSGELPSAFYDNLLPETYVITRKEDDYMESTSIAEKFKEILFLPLTRSECSSCLTEWAATLGKELDAQVLEIAVELAFLLLDESGRELSFSKDIVERASKITMNSTVSIDNLWEIFVSMYPQMTKENGGLIRLLLGEDKSTKTLDEIAHIINKKFNLVLPVKKEEPIGPPAFLVDLNEKMKDRAQFAVGNDRRITQLMQALKGLDKTNAILIGSPGVGKTTLVESIAWMIAHNKIDETSPFFGKSIYSLDLNRMMVGTKYVGETNQRVHELFQFLSQNPGAILFVDEIQQLIGAGVAEGAEMGSIAQLMKPYLLAYGITVIGATTPAEYNRWIQTDTTAAFGRRFKEVQISNPTEDECVLMLTHLTLSELFKEVYPTIEFAEGSIRLAVQLMSKIKSKIGEPDRSKDFLEKIAGRLATHEDKVVTVEKVEHYYKEFHQAKKTIAAP